MTGNDDDDNDDDGERRRAGPVLQADEEGIWAWLRRVGLVGLE